MQISHVLYATKWLNNWTELQFANWSSAVQPINFVTLTRVTNKASCNWVNLVQLSSVQFSLSGVNTALQSLSRALSR